MGPALPLNSNPSLDHEGVKTAIDRSDLNTCGLDGFPQHVCNEIVKYDRYIYDIFQVNLKQSFVPPPPSPPPSPPPPPFPSPPSTTHSVCCGGGTKYDVEEPKCQRGMFNGNPGTRCRTGPLLLVRQYQHMTT